MGEKRYEVVFRGDVVPGQSIVDVKKRLAELFSADSDRIDGLFSGRPVVIKRDLDQASAERYRDGMYRAGAMVTLRALEPEEHIADSLGSTDPAPEPRSPSTGNTTSVEVAPVGADVLAPEYRQNFTPADIDTSDMSIAEVGSDVLREDEKQTVPERDVDTSHLSLDDPQ